MLRFSLLFLLLSCNLNANKPQPGNSSSPSRPAGDSIKQPPEPDPFAVRRRLFDYFARHQHLDTFDTSDATIQEYWGIVNHPPATVTAGRLLHPRQVHSILYYSDETGDGMYLYRKNRNGWTVIFADTTLSFYGPHAPQFRDWNGDGIRDVSISRTGITDKMETYDLWLTDRDGGRLRPVKDFSDIPDPEPADRKGYLNAEYYSGGFHSEQYRFRGTRLESVYTVYTGRNWETENTDSAFVVTIGTEGRKEKYYYGTPEKIVRQVPVRFRDMVRSWLKEL